MKKRNCKHKGIIAVAALVIIAAGLYAASGLFFAKSLETVSEMFYEMPNKNITWSGAGFNGVYGGSSK